MKSLTALITGLLLTLFMATANAERSSYFNFPEALEIPETDQTNLKKVLNGLMLNNSIGLRYGTPSSKQILPINTKELYFQRRLPLIGDSLLIPAFEASISQLNVGEGKGYVWGLGPAGAIPLTESANRLYLVGHAKVNYLTKHDYGRKRYGGQIQWTYGFGLQTKVSYNTFISYMWIHMSNADRYEVNPALETHTMTLGVNF